MMFVIYSIAMTFLMSVISYPLIKFYQLNGYDIKYFLNNIFYCPFRLDDKNKLIFTNRILRFFSIYLILLFIIFILVFYYVTNFWLLLLDILIIALISPLIISFSHMLIYPLENYIKRKYIKKTKIKLQNFKGVKIAIVGSYGKTSIKNILTQILSDKYNVVATPKNFNTPMGICKTVQNMEEEPEIMIFEMGARKKGDIKELMDIVDPDWGIMSAVGIQHLESFGDEESIMNTKFELVKYMKAGGKIIFNNACENTKLLYDKCDITKFSVGEKEGLSWAEGIKYTSDGLSFDLCIDKKKARVETKLLGRFNCENIVVASAMAYLLGISFENIAKRIKQLRPTKNRLELIDNGKFLIIDDSYNANVEGAREGLEVLDCFEGRKIVVTSGLVELGELQYEKNFNLGKQIGNIADIVLIMNETNKKALTEGIKVSGFNKENLYFAKSREEQKNILSKIVRPKCVVLFQNDLPDNYR